MRNTFSPFLLLVLMAGSSISSCSSVKKSSDSPRLSETSSLQNKNISGNIMAEKKKGELQAYLEWRINTLKKGVGLFLRFMEDPTQHKQSSSHQFERIFDIAVGETSVGSHVKPDADTIFEVGSITKTFVGVLFGEMIERGEIGLNDKVADLLPPHVILPDDAKEMTLLHLATHTSGLPENPPAEAVLEGKFKQYSMQQFYDWLRSIKITEKPGTAYLYSNIGTGLLGQLLARKAGKSFESLLQERILDPLKMDSTFFLPPERLKKHMALGHHNNREEALDKSHEYYPDIMIPAGALYSSAHDLQIWLESQIAPPNSTLGAGIQKAKKVYFKDDKGHKLGLLWHYRQYGNKSTIGWGGHTAGFLTDHGFSEDGSFAYILLTNTDNYSLGDVLENLLDPQSRLTDFVKPKDAQAISPQILEKAAGIYFRNGLPFCEISKNGESLFMNYNARLMELFLDKDNYYYLVDPPSGIGGKNLFELDPAKNITGFSVLSTGGTTTLPKGDMRQIDTPKELLDSAAGIYGIDNQPVMEVSVHNGLIEGLLLDSKERVVLSPYSDGFFYSFLGMNNGEKIRFLMNSQKNAIGLDLWTSETDKISFHKIRKSKDEL